jgi:hypothetical protein
MVKSCPSPNPASTLTNVKYANDNISTGDSIFQARVQCTLNANTDYIVVTSGSNNTTQGTFNNQISGPGTPTIVKLIAFSASGYADGVLLAWRTGYEVDNLGFRLYRDEGEQRRPLTPLLAGSALLAGPGTVLGQDGHIIGGTRRPQLAAMPSFGWKTSISTARAPGTGQSSLDGHADILAGG